MKKILALLCITSMLFLISACGTSPAKAGEMMQVVYENGDSWGDIEQMEDGRMVIDFEEGTVFLEITSQKSGEMIATGEMKIEKKEMDDVKKEIEKANFFALSPETDEPLAQDGGYIRITVFAESGENSIYYPSYSKSIADLEKVLQELYKKYEEML